MFLSVDILTVDVSIFRSFDRRTTLRKYNNWGRSIISKSLLFYTYIVKQTLYMLLNFVFFIVFRLRVITQKSTVSIEFDQRGHKLKISYVFSFTGENITISCLTVSGFVYFPFVYVLQKKLGPFKGAKGISMAYRFFPG